MGTIETLEYVGLTIELCSDDSPESPREWDNLGTILADHRNYDLADKDAPTHLLPRNGERTIEETVKDVQKELGERVLWFPVRMYEHGSVGLKAITPDTVPSYPWNCPWDSGWVGIVYVPYSKLRTEYSVKRVTGKTLEKAKGVLVAEIQTYGEYINGEVYGYTVKDSDGNVLDSCWGFYGWDYLVSQAKESAEYHAKELATT